MRSVIYFILGLLNEFVGYFIILGSLVWLLLLYSDLRWLFAFPIVGGAWWAWYKAWGRVEEKLDDNEVPRE